MELYSFVTFEKSLDFRSKEKQQQPPKRKLDMNEITGLAKNWPVYEAMCISKVHLRSKERQSHLLKEEQML